MLFFGNILQVRTYIRLFSDSYFITLDIKGKIKFFRKQDHVWEHINNLQIADSPQEKPNLNSSVSIKKQENLKISLEQTLTPSLPSGELSYFIYFSDQRLKMVGHV